MGNIERLSGWAHLAASAGTACGAGGGDKKPEPKPSACGAGGR